MAIIHDEIENWLAADLYGELSDEEQRQLHTHLVECVACRKTHQETKTINKILEETLAQERPDPSFEQRMLAGFRNRVPERAGLLKWVADLMRLRAAQVTAVAAVLLGLVQLGRMITGETTTPLRARDRYANEQLFEQPAQVAASGATRAGALAKSDELAAARPEARPLQAPPPSSSAEMKDKTESVAEVERTEKAKELRTVAEKQVGRVRNSTFSRDPDGRELANVWLRVPMKNYTALMQSLDSLGKVENVTVQRQDRTGTQIDEANAPADISIQVYSQGNIVAHQSGPLATLRRTLAQSAGAIMWSVRMIGVAIAFLAPWVIAIVAIVWIAKRVIRARR